MAQTVILTSFVCPTPLTITLALTSFRHRNMVSSVWPCCRFCCTRARALDARACVLRREHLSSVSFFFMNHLLFLLNKKYLFLIDTGNQ